MLNVENFPLLRHWFVAYRSLGVQGILAGPCHPLNPGLKGSDRPMEIANPYTCQYSVGLSSDKRYNSYVNSGLSAACPIYLPFGLFHIENIKRTTYYPHQIRRER